jgi:hypothetical protein
MMKFSQTMSCQMINKIGSLIKVLYNLFINLYKYCLLSLINSPLNFNDINIQVKKLYTGILPLPKERGRNSE